MRENQLEHVPDELGDCESLHVLDVKGNRLNHLPISLAVLKLKGKYTNLISNVEFL